MATTQTQQRKTIELKSGVSLDGISEGDIIFYDGARELVTMNFDNNLRTLKRLQRDYPCQVIMRTEREIVDYQQELGRFTHCCGRVEGISQKSYPREYVQLNKILRDAGL